MNRNAIWPSAGLLVFLITVASTSTAFEPIPRRDLESLKAKVRIGRCDQAMIGVRALKQRFPDDPDLFVIEANCVLQGNRRQETRFVPEAYWTLRLQHGNRPIPSSASATLFRTQVIYAPETIERALNLIAEAIRRSPLRRDLYLGACFLRQETGQHEALLDAVDLAAIRFPDREMSRALLSYARAYLEAGMAHQALQVTEVVARHFPQDEENWATMARCRLAIGDLDGGRSALARAVNQAKTDMDLARETAQVAMLARSWTEAGDYLRTVLEQEPNDARALFQLTFCQARTNTREAFALLARFQAQSKGRGAAEHRGAAQLGRLLRQEIPPSAEAWHDLGARMASAGLVGAALAAWEFALVEDPTHLTTLQAMGDLYAGLRIADRAEEAYRHAMALLGPPSRDSDAGSDDQWQGLQARLARALTRAERFPEARAAFEALADPASHALTLAWVCEQMGDLDAARQWLESAASREETAGVAHHLLDSLDRRIRSGKPAGP